MSKYILLSEKYWHVELFSNLQKKFNKDEWAHIKSKSEFTLENLKEIKPDKIFIPHWSYIIPESIFSTYECIVFHMTDLPFGRGGSPLQNLIIRGYETTKISAIKVSEGIDTGDVYLKKSLNLKGTAKEIFISASPIIEEMIVEILYNEILPIPQVGEIVEFKRRKPEDGNMINLLDVKEIYDYIRMLDCDGYPNAYIETDSIKIEFTNAELKSKNNLEANVRIFKK
jgi:methionyl-tRNA formyltransferase